MSPYRAAGWTKGRPRSASIYVLPEYQQAAGLLAKRLNIPAGVLTERALLHYFESLENGDGVEALQAVEEVSHLAEDHRGYVPRHGGAEFQALVDAWGPAPHRPKSGFRWHEGACATRQASQGTAYHCLWCNAHSTTGGPVTHTEDCPTIAG